MAALGLAGGLVLSALPARGGPATEARLKYPIGIALSADGSLYIADTANYRIRRVDPAGVIRTFAGTGEPGYSGDGGPATEAMLNYAPGVAVDRLGNVFFADEANHRIRKVDPDGLIATIAGTGEQGFSGDGGPATLARLDSPFDVDVDGDGSLYIADQLNRRIRKVDPQGIITTVAGRDVPNDPVSFHLDALGYAIGDGGPATAASLSYPLGVAIGRDGQLYISDTGHNRIRRVDPTGTITTVAGIGLYTIGYVPLGLGDGGPAERAVLNYPGDVALDQSGNIYIADRFNNRVRFVDAATLIISTVAGIGVSASLGDEGPATSAGINGPVGLAVAPSGDLYISDFRAHRVRMVDRQGIIHTVAGTGEPGYSGDEEPN